MIEGIEAFRNHFMDWTDHYILIGGAACDLLFQESSGAFRATHDLDIVLMMETKSPEFGRRVWEFIQIGGYRRRERCDGSRQLYRFEKPEQVGYPRKLELFSRSTVEVLHAEQKTVPIHFGEDASSLSSILLEDDYYGLLESGKLILNRISVLSASHLIPLKAKAWLDLSARKEAGQRVDSADIKKHRNDVFRLATLLSGQETIRVPEGVKRDMKTFMDNLHAAPPDPQSLKLGPVTASAIIDVLKSVYA